MTFEQGKASIEKLSRYFETNKAQFRATGVREAHIRQALIDPFFEALGWDMRNDLKVAPQYREVVVEDSLEIEGTQKAPDYAFRVGTTPKFYVEAKKCGVNLKNDPAPAYQLRRYGWSAKLSLSILTDFEEFAVYDCTKRPISSDRASSRRIMYMQWPEYAARWREIWDVFSREAVWSGRFDQYIGGGNKRGTTEVDAEFLKEIEGWREELARNIALRNPDISVEDLNSAVQRTIDRVIFLRMAEDRRIEPERQLLRLCEQPDIYKRFVNSLCRKADEKYNSGLFHFKKEDGIAEAPDRVTPRLLVDDRVFKPIIQNLYFEHGSPYQFDVLPVEILGTVYERFLGKVIRLTAGHRARIEEKPEVRKAGGVYYTPSYIVDYIVRNTVGKRADGKSPTQIAGARGGTPLRILDMACGSGSFLLGAYQYLLNHCLSWYLANNPEKHPKAVLKHPRSGNWRLTIEEKKRILTTHIFGVDIDLQAVEVAKLSLMLKALEGEDDLSFTQQLELFHDRALPNLAGNIKCGNSLIGPDFHLQDLLPDPDEAARINPFDWKRGFPTAMEAGGFDCVIGNPPYVPVELIGDAERAYFSNAFPSIARKYDISVLFILCGLLRLRESGLLGFISTITWQTGENYGGFRRQVIGERHLVGLVNLPFNVFSEAYVDTAIYIISSEPSASFSTYSLPKNQPVQSLDDLPSQEVPYSTLDGQTLKLFANPLAGSVLARIRQCHDDFVTLGSITSSTQGHALAVYQTTARRESAKHDFPILVKGNLYRYSLACEETAWASLREKPTLVRFYSASPKILIRRMINRSDRLMAAYWDTEMVFKKDINPFVLSDSPIPPYALLALVNSKLLSYLYVNTSAIALKNDFRQTTLAELRGLPIPSKGSVELTRVATLAQKLSDRRKGATSDSLTQEAATLDREIDRLVYVIYGLSAPEIAAVEASYPDR